jgi:RNA polymerase sigma factor FliA
MPDLPEEVVTTTLHLVNAVAAHLPSYVDRQDLAQEAHLRVLRAYPKYDPDAGISLKTFLYKHIRGAVLDSLRKAEGYSRHKGKRVSICSLDSGGYNANNSGEDEREIDVADVAVVPADRIVLEMQKARIIRDAISTLVPLRASVVYLYFWEEKDCKEIGELFDVSESRISQIISSSLMHIGDVLHKAGLI